jgi:hypothetical protein
LLDATNAKKGVEAAVPVAVEEGPAVEQVFGSEGREGSEGDQDKNSTVGSSNDSEAGVVGDADGEKRPLSDELESGTRTAESAVGDTLRSLGNGGVYEMKEMKEMSTLQKNVPDNSDSASSKSAITASEEVVLSSIASASEEVGAMHDVDSKWQQQRQSSLISPQFSVSSVSTQPMLPSTVEGSARDIWQNLQSQEREIIHWYNSMKLFVSELAEIEVLAFLDPSDDVERALKAVAELERQHDCICGEMHQLYWQYKYAQIKKTCDQERDGAQKNSSMPFFIQNGTPFMLSLSSQSMFSAVPESFSSVDILMKNKLTKLEKLHQGIQEKIGWLSPLHSRLQRLRNYYLGPPPVSTTSLSSNAFGQLVGYDAFNFGSSLGAGSGSKKDGAGTDFDPASCWKEVEDKRTEVYDLSLRAQEMDSIMYGTGNEVHVHIQISRAMRKLLMDWSELLETLKGRVLAENLEKLAPEVYPQTCKELKDTEQRRKDFEEEWTTIVQEFTMQQHVSDSDLRKLKDEIHHLQLMDRQAQKTIDKGKQKQEKENKMAGEKAASTSEVSLSSLTDALAARKGQNKSPASTVAQDAAAHARQTNLILTQHKQLDVDSRMRSSWVRSLERRHNLLRKFFVYMQWILQQKSSQTARMCGGSLEASARLSQAVGCCWLEGLKQAYMEWKALGAERELIADCEFEDKKSVEASKKKKKKKSNNNTNSSNNIKGVGGSLPCETKKSNDDTRGTTGDKMAIAPSALDANGNAAAASAKHGGINNGKGQFTVKLNVPHTNSSISPESKNSGSANGSSASVQRNAKKRQSCTGGFNSESAHVEQPVLSRDKQGLVKIRDGLSVEGDARFAKKRELAKEDELSMYNFMNGSANGGRALSESFEACHIGEVTPSANSNLNGERAVGPGVQNHSCIRPSTKYSTAINGKQKTPAAASSVPNMHLGNSSGQRDEKISSKEGKMSPKNVVRTSPKNGEKTSSRNGVHPNAKRSPKNHRHTQRAENKPAQGRKSKSKEDVAASPSPKQEDATDEASSGGAGFVFGEFIIDDETKRNSQTQNSGELNNGAAREANTGSSKGLMNLDGDNSCFVNVVIQALWHLASFQTEFRKSLSSSWATIPNDGAKSSASSPAVSENRVGGSKHNTSFAISTALRSLFLEIGESGKESVSSNELRAALFSQLKGNDGSDFRAGMMNDATETHETILEQLHQELREEESFCSEGRGAYPGHNNSLVNRVFGIHVAERFVCPLCHEAADSRYVMTRVQYVHTTQIYSERVEDPCLSFDEVLRKVCGEGDQQSCTAKGCRLQRKIHAKKFLMQLPSVFTIGLVWKSIQPSDHELEDMLKTINMEIDLSRIFEIEQTENVDTTDTHTASSLRLRGMFCFFGHHYMAMFFDEECSQWLSLNDADVSSVGANWSDVVEVCREKRFYPSLLFYESRN